MFFLDSSHFPELMAISNKNIDRIIIDTLYGISFQIVTDIKPFSGNRAKSRQVHHRIRRDAPILCNRAIAQPKEHARSRI
ncbi:hypothetical protein DPPLL_34960 [Desulfofustis limnaeus]|uniref:Uncharacterized protein n=1 Tax=Desulfofustis limnaeus TaxID=2740163 RepID=A0ABM7WDT5_9BACT|nr:hypothetical protein DPPLL_34960 [Desulfofustis limnaeus]